MNNRLFLNKFDISAFNKNWGWFLVWGIALIILGAVAVSAATLTTLLSVVFIGAVIFISGIVVLIDTFTFWRRKGKGFSLHLLMSILYLGAGIILMYSPLAASISITLLLGILYVLLGVSRLAYSFSFRAPRWGWSFFNGIVTLLLGLLILASWPASSLYIIGLFVGIDLIFCGLAYVMTALASRSLSS